MDYAPTFRPPELLAGERARWFLFRQGQLVVRGTGPETTFPVLGGPEELGLRAAGPVLGLGVFEEVACLAAAVDPPPALPTGFGLSGLREMFGVVPEVLYGIAGRAAHLLWWDQTHRYCGRCGAVLDLKADERAKLCPGCSLVIYPQIAPAVIVAVRNGDRLLLAHNPRHRRGMYSVVAGFVEAGESLEQCARREILEEVGIEVHNLRYFGSQAWPYPNSLMLGFTAEYASGQIRVDGQEILEAGWFAANRLPDLPGKLSIARALIDDFVRQQTGGEK